MRAHFIPAGEAALELLEATADDSPIAKYVAKRGPGLHHITLRVADIRAGARAAEGAGVRLIDESRGRVRTDRSSRSSIPRARMGCWWS